MITGRQFTKTLGGAVTWVAINPGALWSGEPTAGPALVSPGAAELYRKAFVMDANVLGAIGFLVSIDDTAGLSKRIVGSDVNAVKSTPGGPQGNFEEALAEIAKADLLIEKHPQAFFKVQRVPISIGRRANGSSALFTRLNRRTCLSRNERIELFRSLGVRVMQLTYSHRTPLGAVVSTLTRMA